MCYITIVLQDNVNRFTWLFVSSRLGWLLATESTQACGWWLMAETLPPISVIKPASSSLGAYIPYSTLADRTKTVLFV
jgi:hypothetical protein